MAIKRGDAAPSCTSAMHSFHTVVQFVAVHPKFFPPLLRQNCIDFFLEKARLFLVVICTKSLMDVLPVQVEALNSASVDDIAAAVTAAVHFLAAPSTAPPLPSTLGCHVLSIATEAHRRRDPTGTLLADALSATTLSVDRCDAFVAAYQAAVAKAGPALESRRPIPLFPQLHGVEWEFGHTLGDRSVELPLRSVPYLKVALKTSEGRKVDGGAFPAHVGTEEAFTCSLEQAQVLLQSLQSALQEAEAAVKGQ